MIDTPHKPVMLFECMQHLNIKPNGLYVDVTFGAGGYTRQILEMGGRVIAFDRDPSVLPAANTLQSQFGQSFKFINDRFSSIKQYVEVESVDGLVADFGISSMQVDDAERGFSFNKEAKLDMRMNQGEKQISAYEIINAFDEKSIADIIFKYGEEVKSRKIAHRIITQRKTKPIETTTELANIVFKCYGSFAYRMSIHPATKTFQALRIYVNKELEEIETLLASSIDILKPSARGVFVSFHSLEDSLVKQFINERLIRQKVNKYQSFSLSANTQIENQTPILIKINKDVVLPTTEEINLNKRSRSAKLRCFEKA